MEEILKSKVKYFTKDLFSPVRKDLPHLPGISLALGPGPPAMRLIYGTTPSLPEVTLPESELLSSGRGRVCQQDHPEWALALHRGSPSKSLYHMG